jgi:hypothetical protein
MKINYIHTHRTGYQPLFLANLSHAAAEIKEVCKDKKDKAGKSL